MFRISSPFLLLVVGLLLLAYVGIAFSPLPTQQRSQKHFIRRQVVSRSARNSEEDENVVDAEIEDPDANKLSTPLEPRRKRKRDIFKNALKRLTELSLMDYKWRSSVFKMNEADRRMEESLARMLGQDPSYVRPMDASESKIGPLGRAEQMAVKWLSQVIEEEGKRAQNILSSDGELVRPIDSVSRSSERGPLADLEQNAVDFLNKIRDAEKARIMSGTVRPKDMDASTRGPLGDAELRAVEALREIRDSEKLRLEQSKLRKGEIVRPIDVPGPLGEFERSFADIIRAERKRSEERGLNQGKLVRPKDASIRGPFGEAEEEASRAFERLTEEERERLRNIQRYLQERRPMETDEKSLLGLTEAVVVGITRAPRLLVSVVERVKELMMSEALSQEDQNVLDTERRILRPGTDETDCEDRRDSSATEEP